MSPELCMGILADDNGLQGAALEANRPVITLRFPRSPMGVEALKGFLANYQQGVRLAVTGATALHIALAVGNVAEREVFILSAAVADQPAALAHYAKRAA